MNLFQIRIISQYNNIVKIKFIIIKVHLLSNFLRILNLHYFIFLLFLENKMKVNKKFMNNLEKVFERLKT